MRVTRLASLFLLAIAACDTSFSGALDQASSCPIDPLPMPDLAQPQAKCAAAKGLPGDNLLCVDFSQTTIEELKGKGWNFSLCTEGWIIDKGALQVSDFKTFASTCQFTIPALNTTDYSKYNKFTLSILHTLDIIKNKQTAAIYFGVASDDQLLWLGTGKNPRQMSMFSVAKQAIPNGGSGKYQPVFQLTATASAGTSASGWQIESIAIQGEL